jgi:outer membrane receptor protein involved in Fe transport
MFQKRPIALAVQAALGLSTAMSAVPLMAATQAEAQAADKQIVEEIVVTGSRIERANEVTSSPVVQLDAEQFTFAGTTRVEDVVAQLPQVYLDQSAGQSIESLGVATMQLRNLGVNRTLVLVDGKRLPIATPKATDSGPDLNFIPSQLVERVEVLTGGASATYGSDAVAGVVNFTMKDDFEGISFDYQSSLYHHDNNGNVTANLAEQAGYDVPQGTRNDGDTQDASLIIGGNLSDGRGNVTVYGTYRNIKPVTQSERDYSVCALNSGRTACGGSGTSAKGSFYHKNYDPPQSFYFNVEGTNFVNFDLSSLYNFAPPSYFQRPDKRYTMGGFAHYDVNEHVTAYTELMWMDDQTTAQFAPAGLFYDFGVNIACNNPELSAQQVTAMGCASPADVIQGVYIGRRNVEGGPRFGDFNTQTYRGVFGFKGQINDAWRYDASYQYGEVDMHIRNGNYVSTAKIAKALDVSPDPANPTQAICNSVLDGTDPSCVPWNIFSTGGVTQAAVNYISASYYETGSDDQTVFTAYVQGDLGQYGVKSPWAEHGIDVVLGGERRQENLDYQPDDLSIAGAVGGLSAPLVPVNGGYTVKEGFTEASVPIVQGKRFMEDITLDLGYRYSDYTTDVNTDTYKFAGSWAIDNQVKFRASYQRAVRAANIVELFQPANGTLFSMNNDPCDRRSNGVIIPGNVSVNGYTEAQCARSGVTAAIWAGGGAGSSNAKQYNTWVGGNPNLDPEESDTYSAGVILTPNFAEGLSLTVDYYDIKVDKAITQVNGATTLRLCIEGNDATCALVHRNHAAGDSLFLGQGGPDNGVNAIYINSGFLEVKGIDAEAHYTLAIGERWGSVNFSDQIGWVESWQQEEYPGAGSELCDGNYGESCETPLPDLRNRFTATWQTPWNVMVNFSWRYVSPVDMVKTVPADERVNIDAYHYFDIAASWNVTDWFTVRGGVNNLLDEEPPITDNGVTLRNNGNTYPGGYDYMGQYWFIAATFQM